MREETTSRFNSSRVEPAIDSMIANHALLETVNASPETSKTEPALTVCVPIAILTENEAHVVGLVEKLKKQQGDFDGPIELILWTNAKYTTENEKEISSRATQAYEALKTAVANVAEDSSMQIKIALQTMPEADFSMSKLRSDYMDALIIEAEQRGYGFDHPVLWLDADTTRIKRGSLRAVADGIKSLQSLFVHTDLYYSFDWVSDTPLSKADDATRTFVADEVVRRMKSQRRRSKNPDLWSVLMMRDYFEETGAGFALGTYLNSGGVNTHDPINETGRLTVNAQSSANIIPKQLFNKKIEATEMDAQKKDWYLNQGPASTRHLPDALVFASGRRYYEGLRRSGRLPLKRGDPTPGGQNDEYELWTDSDQRTRTDAVPIDTRHILDKHKVGYSDSEVSTAYPVSKIFAKYIGDIHRRNIEEEARPHNKPEGR